MKRKETKMSHTPGPWKDEITEEGELLVRMDKRHSVYIGDIEDTCRECHANARLVAAAPELLEALQAFVDYHATDYEDIPEMEQARRIIAKAKGEDVPA
jgi:hypothetical protein